MFRRLEDFLLNKFAGKLISRGVVLATGLIVGNAASAHLTLDPAEVSGALMLGANWLFEWFKARRMANPTSPTVQTDTSKQGLGF